MKKYVFLAQGFREPTPEIMEAWMSWFGSIGDSIVDSGNPFGPGREVSPTGTKDLPLGPDSLTGYMIVNAESMDDAEALLADCPMINGMLIYETIPM